MAPLCNAQEVRVGLRGEVSDAANGTRTIALSIRIVVASNNVEREEVLRSRWRNTTCKILSNLSQCVEVH